MKYELIQRNFNLKNLEGLEDLYKNHDTIAEIQNRLFEKIAKKRENQIIKSLKKRGHIFQNKQQLYEFAKRCEIHTFEDKPHEKELICFWSEKMTFNHDVDRGKWTFTVNVG